MLSVKFYTKNLIKNYENNHQETENHLSNYIVKNGQKFVDIILLLIPTDVKTIFQHKNQTVKLRVYFHFLFISVKPYPQSFFKA
jgi:hypothetical protein